MNSNGKNLFEGKGASCRQKGKKNRQQAIESQHPHRSIDKNDSHPMARTIQTRGAKNKTTVAPSLSQAVDVDRNNEGEGYWVCKMCDEEFGDRDDKFVVCGRCEEPYCIECLGMRADQCNLLSDPAFHWYCPNCKAPALHAVRDDFDIEERCEAFFEKLSGRMQKLEMAMSKKAEKVEVEGIRNNIEHFRSSTSELTKELEKLSSEVEELKSNRAEGTEEVAAMYINEMEDRNRRKPNLIIFSIGESEDPDPIKRKETDIANVSKIFEEITSTTIEITDCRRLGKRKLKNEQQNPRPMRVSVSDQHQRDNILKSAKKLRENDETKHITIRNDMTPRERTEDIRLRKEWQAKKEQSVSAGDTEAKWIRRGGKVVNIGMYIQKQGKTERGTVQGQEISHIQAQGTANP